MAEIVMIVARTETLVGRPAGLRKPLRMERWWVTALFLRCDVSAVSCWVETVSPEEHD